ncbi:MAG: hypothetical protein BJ554DRAFT_1061 [Olpidium bornovanus]|uniref:Stress response protein NST1 n=1 Tax=Olpidium bornovanus TaxID=278681 RepID=A0A8H7ZSQ1_9FUNG|nr:MAG: hypothetical protein BJ554DRAFT_1061 [Olpidium bornovanus]
MTAADVAPSRCPPPRPPTPKPSGHEQHQPASPPQAAGDSCKAVIYNKVSRGGGGGGGGRANAPRGPLPPVFQHKTLCRHIVKEDCAGNGASTPCRAQPASPSQPPRASGCASAHAGGGDGGGGGGVGAAANGGKKKKRKPKKDADQVSALPPPEYGEEDAGPEDPSAAAASAAPVVAGYCESCASRRATCPPPAAGKPNGKPAPASPRSAHVPAAPPAARGAGAPARPCSRAGKRKKDVGDGPPPSTGNRAASRTQQQRQQQQLRQQRLANLKLAAERKSLFSDSFWKDDTAEERGKLREFWLQLPEGERKRLVQIEREALELERFYGTYYRELEYYANPQQSSFPQDEERHVPAAACANKSQGHSKQPAQARPQPQSHQHQQHSHHQPQPQIKVAAQGDLRSGQPDGVHLPADGVSEGSAFGSDYEPTDFEDSDLEDSEYEESDYDDGEREEDEDDGEDGDEDEEDEEGGELDDEGYVISEEDPNDGRYDGYAPVGGAGASPADVDAPAQAGRSVPAPVLPEWARQTKENAHHYDFGRSLTVKGAPSF